MEQESKLLVLKGRVIDGNGGSPIEKGLVAVSGDRILAVCNEWEYTIPPGATVIEIADGSIMPGMVEMHVHLALTSNFYEVYTTHPYHAVCTALQLLKADAGKWDDYWAEDLFSREVHCADGGAF